MSRIEEGDDAIDIISPLVRFWNDRRGAIAAEFGIVTPILMALILGTFEGTRYVLLHQKLDRMAVDDQRSHGARARRSPPRS